MCSNELLLKESGNMHIVRDSLSVSVTNFIEVFEEQNFSTIVGGCFFSLEKPIQN